MQFLRIKFITAAIFISVHFQFIDSILYILIKLIHKIYYKIDLNVWKKRKQIK